MRISKIKYFDQTRHWNLNSMTFKKLTLTLLVGAPGVGKTQKRLSQTPDHLYTLNSFFHFCTDIHKVIEKSV
jgi:replication-associated recombination protein RarA